MKTRPYSGNVHHARFLTKECTKPCPVCGQPARKYAVFDMDEVHLIGYCKDEHVEVPYDWPSSGDVLNPREARFLGFTEV